MHEFDEHQRHDLARDITARLRRVCAHMSATEFDDLVDDLIAMKARFRAIERDTSLWYAIDRDAPGAADPRLGPRWFDREVARPRAPGRQNG